MVDKNKLTDYLMKCKEENILAEKCATSIEEREHFAGKRMVIEDLLLVINTGEFDKEA